MDYSKLYNDLISFRKANPLTKSKEIYTEKHHILPRCLGGDNSPENLVRLTGREHFIAHRLLAKMHPGNPKLCLAVLIFVYAENRQIQSSREFEKLKEISSEFMSRSQRDRVSKQWEERRYRDMMCKMFSDSMRNRWKSKAYQETMSEQSRRFYQDPDFVSKKNDGYKDFLKQNPWPWQRTTGVTREFVWGLAATFWELGKFNPDLQEPPYSITKFSNEFCDGKYIGMISKMSRMFKAGWIPKECPQYLEKFGHIM